MSRGFSKHFLKLALNSGSYPPIPDTFYFGRKQENGEPKITVRHKTERKDYWNQVYQSDFVIGVEATNQGKLVATILKSRDSVPGEAFILDLDTLTNSAGKTCVIEKTLFDLADTSAKRYDHAMKIVE